MNFNSTIQPDLLDILFANRNKDYGAYPLRRNYNKRLFTALLVMFSVCLAIALFSAFRSKHSALPSTLLVSPVVNILKVKDPEPIVPVKPKVQLPKLKPATIQLSTIKLVQNEPITPPPTQDAVDDVKIDVRTSVGTPGETVTPPVEETGTGDTKELIAAEDYTKVFTSVQQEAQFPGGLDAWRKFLERTLRQDTPMENGAPAGSYTVQVSFLVDREGNISNVKATIDPGFGTAAEAVRVISQGPKWQPAIQNGRSVAYRQTQNITFLVEQN